MSADYVRGDYVRLMLLKRTLTKMSNAIQKEMTQTDVEWMNLSAISEDLKKSTTEARTTEKTAQSSEIPKPVSTEIELDSQAELPKLNLNPDNNISVQNVNQFLDEEFDSD